MLKKTRIEQLLLEGKSVSEIAEIVPCTVDYANVVKSKFDIVNGTEQMVEHHTHYKEIHGYDKTVWMTRSEHFKLHQRLRKNGECNVPVDEMKKISMAAHNRTDEAKKYRVNKQREYDRKPEYIKHKRDYNLNNIWEKQYRTRMMPNIGLFTTIRYNIITNHLGVSSGFYGTNYKKPLVIDII